MPPCQPEAFEVAHVYSALELTEPRAPSPLHIEGYEATSEGIPPQDPSSPALEADETGCETRSLSNDSAASSLSPPPMAGSPPGGYRSAGGIRILHAATSPPASLSAADVPGASPRSLASAEWQTARPKGRPSQARGTRSDALHATPRGKGSSRRGSPPGRDERGDGAGGGRKRGKRRGGRRERERLERVAAAAARRADNSAGGGPQAIRAPPPPPPPPPPAGIEPAKAVRPRAPLNFAEAVRGARLEPVDEADVGALPVGIPTLAAPSPGTPQKRRAARSCRRGRAGTLTGSSAPDLPPIVDGDAPVSEWSARTSDAGSDFLHSSPVLASPMSVLSGERAIFAGALMRPSRSWAAVTKEPHWPPPPPPPPRTRLQAATMPNPSSSASNAQATDSAVPASSMSICAISGEASQPGTPSFTTGRASLEGTASAGADALVIEAFEDAGPQLPSELLAEIALDSQPATQLPMPTAAAAESIVGQSGSLFAEDLFACGGSQRTPARPVPNPWADKASNFVASGQDAMWRLQSAGLAGHVLPSDPLAQVGCLSYYRIDIKTPPACCS